MRERARVVYMTIAEPRVQRVSYLLIYALATLDGLTTLFWPPSSIEGVLGATLTVVWASFLLLGGALGSATVLQGWWFAERIGLYCVFVGTLMYAGIVTSLHFSQTGSRLTQLGFILIAIVAFVFRYTEIRRYHFEPRG